MLIFLIWSHNICVYHYFGSYIHPQTILTSVLSYLCQVDSYNKISDHVGKSSQRLVGCWPFSEAYLTSSYFAQQKSLFDSDCHDYIAEEFGSSDFCKGMGEISLLQLSDLQRRLRGEGSHRHLISTLRFMDRSYIRSLLDSHDCKAVIIERLPIGVLADLFELQHLVHRKGQQQKVHYKPFPIILFFVQPLHPHQFLQFFWMLLFSETQIWNCPLHSPTDQLLRFT